jgi:hypothetical protein
VKEVTLSICIALVTSVVVYATASGEVQIQPTAAALGSAQTVTLTASQPVLWQLSGSGSLDRRLGTSVTYRAPARIGPQHTLAGCPVGPADSIFNVRIDHLPQASQAVSWLQPFQSTKLQLVYEWGENLVTAATPRIKHYFRYTHALDGTTFPSPSLAARKRQNGAFANDAGTDHHMLMVDKDSCQFFETYQDGVPVPECPGCTAASGRTYGAGDYAQPIDGSTDAAGLPLAPLTIHLSELQAGMVRHAARMTLSRGYVGNQSIWPATTSTGWLVGGPPMGTRFRLRADYVLDGVVGVNILDPGDYPGGTPGPTVTITGCTVAPTVSVSQGWSSVNQVVVQDPGRGCVSPRVEFSGGSPRRPARAEAVQFGSAALAILRGFQQYGIFLADNGISGQVGLSTDVTTDPDIMRQLSFLTNAITGRDLQIVDESALLLDRSTIQVNPANGYQPIDNYAAVLAIDPSSRRILRRVPIALQPITIGTPEPTMVIQAGTPGIRIPYWVHGGSAAVTWSLEGVGTLDSSGLYTAPQTVTDGAMAQVTIRSTRDPQSLAVVNIRVLPAGRILIDCGRESRGGIADTAGTWLADVGRESGSYALGNDWYPVKAWGAIPNRSVYETFLYTWGDDIVYKLHVPNGRYEVTLMVGHPGTNESYYSTDQWDLNLTWIGPHNISVNGSLAQTYDFGAAVKYLGRTPSPLIFAVDVVDTSLELALQATTSQYGHTVPLLNGLVISPIVQ